MDATAHQPEKTEISHELDDHERSSTPDQAPGVQEKPQRSYIPENDEDYDVT
jgi:hypothetical protein